MPARIAPRGYSQRGRCCDLYIGPAVVTCREIRWAPAPGLERPAIGMCWACRDEAQARVLMIIGLPQSMIIEVSRACRAIIAAGARLGRVLCRHRRGPPGVSPRPPAGLPPPPGARPGGVRACGSRAGARQRV